MFEAYYTSLPHHSYHHHLGYPPQSPTAPQPGPEAPAVAEVPVANEGPTSLLSPLFAGRGRTILAAPVSGQLGVVI